MQAHTYVHNHTPQTKPHMGTGPIHTSHITLSKWKTTLKSNLKFMFRIWVYNHIILTKNYSRYQHQPTHLHISIPKPKYHSTIHPSSKVMNRIRSKFQKITAVSIHFHSMTTLILTADEISSSWHISSSSKNKVIHYHASTHLCTQSHYTNYTTHGYRIYSHFT